MKWLVAIVASLAAFAVAWPASAHVTVDGPGATSGGSDQVITFRVPTESTTASTVRVQVKLPNDTPIASVLVAPHPGWTDTVTSVKLPKPIVTDDGDITEAVSEITWKADSVADGIKPGQYGEFDIIAGLLPAAPSLTFPTIQTYSDGTTVSWIEVAAPGSTSTPEHPAPVLGLGAGSSAPAAAGTGAAKKSSSTAAVVLAVIALAVAAGALGLGVVSRARSTGSNS